MNDLMPVPHGRGNPRFKALFYGHPGSGKTSLAAGVDIAKGIVDAPGKTIFCNAEGEGGMLSIPPSDQVQVFTISPSNPGGPIAYLNSILWAVASGDVQKYPWLAGVKTFVLDSGTDYLNMALEWTVVNQIHTNPKRTNGDPTDVWLEDHGRVKNALIKQMRHMRDLPMNVIVTALTKTLYPQISDDKKKQGLKPEQMGIEPVMVMPYFTDKIGESMMAFFDNVWYFQRSPQGVSVLTQPRGVYRAKTRGTAFPKAIGEVMTNPTLKRICQTLAETESNAAAQKKQTAK